jgi:tRNA modification GTPase
MFERDGDADTICALSTPPGVGGIAVIRVSGPRAFQITRALCSFLPNSPESHHIYFGTAYEETPSETAKKAAIDEVLVSCFANGRSFTGEETTEISSHGSPVLVANLLKELIKSGARMARPGEFTFRAFMNGRMDLVQAESVLALIESQSKPAAQVALRHLKGGLSKDFALLEDDLVWILAQLEASIDFSTEGIDVIPSEVLTARTERVLGKVTQLLESYEQGQVLRDGLRVAILGRPNVGKSSLLNALVREERAIVTDQAGTTRDLVEGQILLGGQTVTFVDTAGLRITENEIEKIGIQRSLQAMKTADLILYVIETENGLASEDQERLKELPKDTYLVINKSDLFAQLIPSGESGVSQVFEKLRIVDWPIKRAFAVSAKTGLGLNGILNEIEDHILQDVTDSSNIIVQARHMELLQRIHSCLLKATELIKVDDSPEFIAFELQDAIKAIHELLGKEFHEQVIDRIFKEFCLGK